MPLPDWKSAIEIHPDGWRCPAEPFWIAGWVTSAAGLVPVDVRARLGDRVFLGLCGLPRPDKETEAHGRAGPPQAGFSFLLQPVADATELHVEVCDQHGRWMEIFHQVVNCVSAPAADARPVVPDTRPLLRLLQAHHARPLESRRDLAREVLTHEIAETFDVMPSAPFKGALEQLASAAAIQYDHLLVTGWVAHRDQKITRLTAFLDTATPLPLLYGLARPDAGALFPELVNAEHSRFAGYLRIPAHLPRPLALRIFAELADGRQELVFLKRFRPVLTSGAGTDLPPFSAWKLLCCARALRQSGWGEGWSGEHRRAVHRAAGQDFRLAAPIVRLPPREPDEPDSTLSRPLRVVFVTHNLNFEGAPLFLIEYARYLAAQPGWSARLVSPSEGPLRATFAAAGIPVDLVDASAVLAADSDAEFSPALDQLAANPVWAEADVIVANTMVAFWAVHVAERLRKPSIFYVHESVGARRFFALDFTPAAITRVEQAFLLATRVAFIAHAAQQAHAALAVKHNFRVLPGWIDIARIRAYEAAHSRTELRRKLDLPDKTVVFANIGSIMPRKGQLLFLEAVALLQRQAPKTPPLAFLLVGAKTGTDPYLDLLQHAIASRALGDVRLIESASDPYRYFQAADICVCSSLEEALPRVVMEAAAFGRLVVSTNVNGIPELLGPDEAWFVPPDDPARLADAMLAALKAHTRGDFARATSARATVSAHSDAATLLPRHANLVRAVAALPPA